MNTVKEVLYQDGGTDTRCFIRNRGYNHSMAHIQGLFEDAKTDFPTLHIGNVDIVIYSGSRIKGIMGIEFKPPSPIPPNYKIIDSVEPLAK